MPGGLLAGHVDNARPRLEDLRARASHLSDRLIVARLRLALHVTLGQANLAVQVGLEFLGELEESLNAHPTDSDVIQQYDCLQRLLSGQPPEAMLLSLPVMNDSRCRAVMQMLADLMPPAEFTDPHLLELVILRMANLSLEFGNCDASCYAYSALHLVLGSRFDENELGYEFARLGCELVDNPALSTHRARVHLCVGGLVIPWTRALASGLPMIRRAFEEANAAGDLTFASYSHNMLVTSLLASGARLDGVEEVLDKGRAYAQGTGFALVIDCLNAQLMLIRTLRGLDPQFLQIDGRAESRESFEHRLEDPRLAIAACWYWIRRMQLAFFMSDLEAADDARKRAAPMLWATGRHFERAEYHFYAALVCAARCTLLATHDREQYWQELLEHRAKIGRWAKNCPHNFADRAALISAEIARLEGYDLEAQRLYEKAIGLAGSQGFLQNEALACELASQFYCARGFETIAVAYLDNARRAYSHWGAGGKVGQLESYHPALKVTSQSTAALPMRIEDLELATVVRMSQAVSSELNLNRLIDNLMIMALQHAGAERGHLVLSRSREFWIEAEARIAGDMVKVTPRGSAARASELPLSIVHYVARSRETVLLDDATENNAFSDDEYLRAHQCRSILCLPLLKQGQLIGVLYLENSQISRVFTSGRVGVLSLLASQAAISLEIARIHAALETENRERGRAEEALRASEASLEMGQQISHTCNWRWTVRTGAAEASAEWYRIYGLDQAIGPLSYNTFIRNVLAEDRARVADALAQAARDQARFSIEFRIVLPSGSIKHLQSRGHPSISEAGELEFIGTDMDITELREAEDKLRLAQADLARALRLRAMGELAGSILHEINQPLAAVVTNAEACIRWLDRAAPDLPEALNALAGVAREGKRAADVVSGLKSLARNSGPALAEVDFQDVIREVLTLTRGETERVGVSLQLDLNRGNTRVWGDRVQIQQVLINLIRNGIEAMEEIADRSKELRISSTREHPNLLVRIEDCGTGIDPSSAKRIFDPLFTTKTNGMGMGLAICRSIVAAHHGRLWATPRAPYGTSVSFTLPLVGP